MSRRKNKKEEQEMVNKIKEKYKEHYVEPESSKSVGGRSSYCDITLKIGNEKYYLEAKHDNGRNRANYPKQAIAECLYNRKHHKGNGKYGILVNCDKDFNSAILNTIKKGILQDDWERFGKDFNCTKIFLFEEKCATLYYMDWNVLYALNKGNGYSHITQVSTEPS